MPPAPGWLSTTRRCPSLSPSFSATMREVTSATPPAANGNTSRGEWVGYFACAAAGHDPATKEIAGSTARPPATARRVRNEWGFCALVISGPPGWIVSWFVSLRTYVQEDVLTTDRQCGKARIQVVSASKTALGCSGMRAWLAFGITTTVTRSPNSSFISLRLLSGLNGSCAACRSRSGERCRRTTIRPAARLRPQRAGSLGFPDASRSARRLHRCPERRRRSAGQPDAPHLGGTDFLRR